MSAAAWGVITLFLLTQGLTQRQATGDSSPWWHHLLAWMIGGQIMAMGTPLVMDLSSRFPIDRQNWLRRVPMHLGFSLVFGVVTILVDGLVLHSLGLFPKVMPTYVAKIVVLAMLGFHQNVLSYWTIHCIALALRYYQRYQERSRETLRLQLQTAELGQQLARARLNALNSQLQPHFLFNTLNAITVLVRQGESAAAEEMLARLSDLLRCVLEEVDTPEVPLRRELEYVHLYLSIEQVRFQDRLRIEILADPSVLDAAVPFMSLQPVVENAIRHGICRSSTAGLIRIEAKQHDGALVVTITDDGPGLPDDATAEPAPAGHGMGLSNARARLAQLYGDFATLTLNNGAETGAVARMQLPYHVAEDHDEIAMMELYGSDRSHRG